MLGLGLSFAKQTAKVFSFVKDQLKLLYRFYDNDPELLLSGATSFDGNDQYISVADDSSLDITDAITVSAWVLTTVSSDHQRIVAKQFQSDTGTGNSCFQLAISNSDKFRWAVGGVFDISSSDSIVTNTWNHMVGTYDKTTAKLYVNGQLVQSASATAVIRTSSQELTIGTSKFDSSIQQETHGSIANVGIWNRALSASEIESIYWKGQFSDLKGTELTNLVSWYNLKETGFGSDVVTNGDLWTGASGSTKPTNWSGSGGGTPTHTIVDLSSVTNFDSTTLRFTATDTRNIFQSRVTSGARYKVEFAYRTDSSSNYIHIGSSGNKITLSNTGLSGDATLVSQEITSDGSNVGIQIITDDSTIEISSIQVYPVSAPDSTGTNNGTIVGATTLTDAYSASSPFLPRIQDKASDAVANYGEVYGGNAVSFDGSNDLISLDGFKFSGNQASFSFWAKFDSVSGTDKVLMDLNPNRSIVYYTASTGLNIYSNNATVGFGTLNINTWYHIVGIFDGTTARMYVNGSQLGTDQTIVALDISSATACRVGTNFTSGGSYFDGVMSGVKVFNTVLTQDQVRELYTKPELTLPTGVSSSALKLDMPMQEGSGTTILDGSGNQNHGTGSGITWATGQEHGFQHPLVRSNNPMVFDGADDKVTVGTPSALNNIFTGGGTLSAWINPKSDGQNNAGQAFDKGKYAFQVISESSGSVKVQFAVTLSGGAARWETPLSVSLNTWTHILVTYDSDNPTTDPIIYLNGSAVSLTETISPSGTYVSDASSNLILGNRNDGVTTFDGLLNDLAIWDSALTANEVTALYNSGLPLLPTSDSGNYASSSDLVGYWRNDGVITWTDRSTNSNNGTVSGSPTSIIVPEGLNEGRDSQGYYFSDADSISSGIRLKGAEHIEINDSEDFTFGTGDFSYDFWFKWTDAGHKASVIDASGVMFTSHSTNSNNYSRIMSYFGTLFYTIKYSGSNVRTVDSAEGAISSANTWYHIALTVDRSSGGKWYINGSESTLSAETGATETNDLNFTGNLRIGAINYDESSDGSFIGGSIDEFRIYKGKVLSASEVLKNYNNGKSAHSN